MIQLHHLSSTFEWLNTVLAIEAFEHKCFREASTKFSTCKAHNSFICNPDLMCGNCNQALVVMETERFCYSNMTEQVCMAFKN